MNPARSRTTAKKKFFLCLAALVAALLLGELAVRVRFYAKYGTFLREHTFAEDAASGLQIPVPGLDTGAMRIDSRGFRNPELEVPKPAGRVRIAFLGASTTYCAEASKNETTWPALVTAAVARSHDAISFDYVNAGVAGYTLQNIQKNLEYRVKPLAPDVIVIYEATNDFTKDSREAAQAQGVYTEHADRDDWLAEISLLWHLIEKNVLVKTRARAAETNGQRVKLDYASLEASYRERYANLIRKASEIAPVVVVATFSQRTRRGMSASELERSCITHYYYMPYIDADSVIEGFAAYNRAIRGAAHDTGAVLIEGEDEIPADAEHFADSVHFTDAGCVSMAQRITRGLEAAPGFLKLVAR